MKVCSLSGFLLLLFVSPAAAQINAISPLQQEVPPPDAPVQKKLTLTAAAEPVPALRYEFETNFVKEKPGNASTYYYRAMLMFRQMQPDHVKKFYEDYDKWSDLSAGEIPLTELRPRVKQFDSLVGELSIATTRERCDWELRLKDLKGPQALSFLLPDAQEMRNLARVLTLKFKLEVAEGRLDDARETLRMGYRMGRDIAKVPTLINGLVGAAIVSMTTTNLEELIQHPDCPNLYWAISTLPNRMIDLRTAMRYEMSLGSMLFPGLEDAEKKNLSPAEWKTLLNTSLESSKWLSDISGNNPNTGTAIMMGFIMRGYPAAKKRMVTYGYTKEQVEKMPVAQVVVIDTFRTYNYARDEVFKWTFLPYSQVHEKIRESNEKLKKAGYFGPQHRSPELIPLTSLLLPAIHQAMLASVRTDRDVAIYRTIEALRMYAAEHDGKFPAKLEDIETVIVPDDPISGNPFGYELKGDTAVLTALAPTGSSQRSLGRVYHLTLRSGN